MRSYLKGTIQITPLIVKNAEVLSQPAFTCSKPIIETREQCVKSIQLILKRAERRHCFLLENYHTHTFSCFYVMLNSHGILTHLPRILRAFH